MYLLKAQSELILVFRLDECVWVSTYKFHLNSNPFANHKVAAVCYALMAPTNQVFLNHTDFCKCRKRICAQFHAQFFQYSKWLDVYFISLIVARKLLVYSHNLLIKELNWLL